jgi:hypothetical protein
VAKRLRLRVGAIDFAKTGRIFWHDAEPERPRIGFESLPLRSRPLCHKVLRVILRFAPQNAPQG